MRVTQEDAGPLYESLLEATEGSRLLRVELGTAERPDPVVIVYDVMHTRAWGQPVDPPADAPEVAVDRKSTRLNSSHVAISYAVFCLKKKNVTASRDG